jgi:hypothetical protein
VRASLRGVTMLSRSRRDSVGRSLAVLTGVLACAVAGQTSALRAQERPTSPRAPLQVRLTATGWLNFLNVYANVRVSGPAYVAIFEVHPDVGAFMVYPYKWQRPGLVDRAAHVDLTSASLSYRRQEFYRRLLPRFQFTSRIQPRGYLVAIASRRPLATRLLESGRYFAHQSGFAGPYDIAQELAALIVPPQPAGDWSYDVYGFWKSSQPALGYLLSPGYLYPRALWGYPAVTCYSTALPWSYGYFPGIFLGSYIYAGTAWYAFGPYSSPCGGYGWGRSWYYPGWYSPGWHQPTHTAQGGPPSAQFVDTNGLVPGFPRIRDRGRVSNDAPGSALIAKAGNVAEGREKRAGVSDPAEHAAGRVTDAHDRRKGVPKVQPDGPERFRELLDELGDARSSAAAGPDIAVHYRQRFERGGVASPSGLAAKIRAQGLVAQERLTHRLESLGIPRSQAIRAAGRAGGAPAVIHRFGSVARVRGMAVPRGSGGRATSRMGGRSVGGSVRVSRPAVSGGHFSPSRASSPRPVSRPAPAHGGSSHGSGGHHGGGASHSH